MRNRVPFILCIIGGLLMIYAGAIGSVGFWEDLVNYATAIAPGFEATMLWVLVILQNIASLAREACHKVLYGRPRRQMLF